jgi:acylglycerol lipase
VRHRELQLPGCHDIALFAQAWLPERDPRAVVVIAHGLAEHGGRYPEVAARLVASDYAVYAMDHRGHGRSGGPRANIDRFAYLVSDLGTFAGRAQREHPGAPVFLLGHSMGGAVALACALRYKGSLKGLAPRPCARPRQANTRETPRRPAAATAPRGAPHTSS